MQAKVWLIIIIAALSMSFLRVYKKWVANYYGSELPVTQLLNPAFWIDALLNRTTLFLLLAGLLAVGFFGWALEVQALSISELNKFWFGTVMISTIVTVLVLLGSQVVFNEQVSWVSGALVVLGYALVIAGAWLGSGGLQ
jgi:hypothetical protein